MFIGRAAKSGLFLWALIHLIRAIRVPITPVFTGAIQICIIH
jgi:hypothetical protein